MQRQHFTSGLKKIPDREYTDEEIQGFYDQDLNAEIDRDRRIHNTPPAAYDWMEELLTPDQFSPESFLFENEEPGELFHPDTPEIARQYFEQEQRRRKERFDARPTFDPAETITCFRDAYRAQLKYGFQNYPDWVQEVVDKRLLALNRIPSSAYKQLKKEEIANRRAFEKINQAAAAALEQQNIPEEIRSQFCFHDADVLAVKKVRSNVELIFGKTEDGTVTQHLISESFLGMFDILIGKRVSLCGQSKMSMANWGPAASICMMNCTAWSMGTRSI